MSNAFASAVFLSRNIGKVNHGAYDRLAATTAQGLGLVGKVAKVDGTVGSVTQKALSSIDAVTKPAAGITAEKVCNVAGKLVNPLLVLAAGIRVLNSDDKEKTLYKEAGAMSTMFAAEALVKSDGCQQLIEKGSRQLTKGIVTGLDHFKVKVPGKLGKIINAVVAAAALVGASIAAYDVGAKSGTYIIDKKREIANIYSADKNHENANLSIKS